MGSATSIKIRKESAFALSAYRFYLALPKPRTLSGVIGQRARDAEGNVGKPFSEMSVRTWSARFRWRERAAAYDREVMAAEKEEEVEFRRVEVRRRERRRLEAAELQFEMAMTAMTYPKDYPDETLRGTPRPLESIDPKVLTYIGQFLKQAGDTERLDLGQATSRHETLSSDDPSGGLGTIMVVSPDALTELRGLVNDLTAKHHALAAPPDEPEVIEGYAEEVAHDDAATRNIA